MEAPQMLRPQWRIAGNAAAVETIARSVESPAHAYLLLGPRRTGKTTLAVELAKALNCLSDGRPCQVCSECVLIGKSGHPDVTYLSPNEKNNLTIDQVRQLRQEINLRPNQARRRVVILPADRLTESAADALLKTLEEPPEHVVLVLTGHELDAIPETVVSRCRLVLFGFVAATEIEAELVGRGVEPERAAILASLAYGAPGWAIEGAEDEELVANREAIRHDLNRWTTGSLRDRIAAAESLSSSGGLDRARTLALEELELMTTWWRDVLVTAVGRPDLVVNDGDRSRLAEIAVKAGPAEILRQVRAITTAATRIDEYVDPRLALEALAVSPVARPLGDR